MAYDIYQVGANDRNPRSDIAGVRRAVFNWACRVQSSAHVQSAKCCRLQRRAIAGFDQAIKVTSKLAATRARCSRRKQGAERQ
jgi:hypothetical protein